MRRATVAGALVIVISAIVMAATPIGQQAPADAARGREVYAKWCTPCHGAGPGKPGTMVMQMRYGDSEPALLEERTDLPPEAIAVFVRQGAGVMPPFRKTEISDVDLGALSAYVLSRPQAP